MTVQVEHLEDHYAQLTATVPESEMDKAMQDAAKKISNQYSIPGFRKGKAPYKTVIRYVGAQNVLEQAVEDLSQVVYRRSLEESQINPYAMGEFIDVKGSLHEEGHEHAEGEAHDHSFTFVYRVPKMPEAELGAYRDIRLAYENPVTEESAVDEAVQKLVDRRATVELVDRGAQLGDKVKFHVTGEALIPLAKLEGDAAESSGNALDEGAGTVEEFIDQEMDDILTDKEDEDLVPGFSAHVVGMKADEEKTFAITLAADFREAHYQNARIDFRVKVLSVSARTLPAIDDEFAKLVSEGKKETLEALRNGIREDLQKRAIKSYENEYVEQALDKMVEGATLRFPSVMIEDNINEMLQILDNNLRRSNLSIDDYKRIQNKDDRQLREDYREVANKRVRRSLVLGEIARLEGVQVTEADIQARINEMAADFGDQRDAFIKVLSSAENAQNIALDLMTAAAQQRIVEIAKGIAPALPAVTETASTETPAQAE